MIVIYYFVDVLTAFAIAGIASAVPIFLIGHIFIVHRLDEIFLGKTLKGTFDDNLWMINTRLGSYASILVLHKFRWYRAFKAYPERRNKKLKGFKFFGFSQMSMNTLEYENKLKDLTFWQRIYLYWLFWSWVSIFIGGGLGLLLSKIFNISS